MKDGTADASAMPWTAPADPVAAGFSPERLARLRAWFAAEIERKHIPGAVTLIVRRGKLAHFEAQGTADPSSGAPMRQNTIFRIYSMTKPIVSVVAMMLMEEGRLLLAEPVAKYVPALAKLDVAVERQGGIDLVPAQNPITIQDLLRHTSGLTYEFLRDGPVQRMYTAAKIMRPDQTNAEQVTTLARMPLVHQPGTRFEYSRSTDVLGHLIEVITGRTLREVLREHVLAPLGMVDTDFVVPEAEWGRIAEPFATDPDAGTPVRLSEPRKKPAYESAGGGLVSTAADYARFMQMMLDGGALGGVRLLGRKTVEYMTSDHLGAIPGPPDFIPPGFGFGLGVTVRLATGLAAVPGSAGLHGWGGIAGTNYWVDPAERMYAMVLAQAPGQRDLIRTVFRSLVYAAIED